VNRFVIWVFQLFSSDDELSVYDKGLVSERVVLAYKDYCRRACGANPTLNQKMQLLGQRLYKTRNQAQQEKIKNEFKKIGIDLNK
jgi:hypothetical protein